MKIQDAIKILGLQDEITMDSIKLAYRRLCSNYHTDKH